MDLSVEEIHIYVVSLAPPRPLAGPLPDRRAGPPPRPLADLRAGPSGGPVGSGQPALSLLSTDERLRSERYRFERDRRRFVASRACLRVLLACYLRVDPAKLVFRGGAHGKPALDAGQQVGAGLGGMDLRFSVAHSDDMALYALASGREVGVDVERVRSDFSWEPIAERFLAFPEAATLRRLARGGDAPSRARSAPAFFAAWTRKEAYLKATGRGLDEAVDRFAVTVDPAQPPRLLYDESDDTAPARWSLREVAPAKGYVGALAFEGAAATIRLRELSFIW